MIEITREPIATERVINSVRSDGSGCVATYVGLIRNRSRSKPVLSVEYRDPEGNAEKKLQEIAGEAGRRWAVEGIAIAHRIGTLRVGEINLVVAVAAAHRREGFAACRFIVDRFKERLPTSKTERYQRG
jgi:molybdopterin synthase catalytic subunit